jgi:hypothetical protein
MKSKILKTIAMTLMTLLLLLSFTPTSYGTDYTIPHTLQEFFWTYGCTPTAASMVLGYWDDHYYFGRLVDFYYMNTCGNSGGIGRHVPNTIDELRTCMGTSWSLSTCSGSGTTPWGNINPGINCVTDSTSNGYSFGYGQCDDCDDIWNPDCWGGDWCWDEIKAEIDADRPTLWSTSGASSGHSVAAWGYRSDKYVILADTWWPGGREDWYYSYYLGNSGDPITYVQLERVWPGGEVLSTLEIDDPVGGETLLAMHPYKIWWHQWGTIINNVDIWYSPDRGKTWPTVIAAAPASVAGWNNYDWWVPNISTTDGRIKITAWQGTGTYIAGDGSQADFTINKPTCSSLSYPTTKWQRVWRDYPGGVCLGNAPDQTSVTFDNNWSTGTLAHSRSNNIQFSSSRKINLSSGYYRFTVGSDDGVRVWIDGVQKINQWIPRAYTINYVDISLSAGYHNFRLDYFEATSLARVSFTYAVIQKSLAVTKKGTGTGTVTSSPAGINCGPDCKENYNYGTVVTLTATPTSPGNVFAGWSGTSADCNDGKVTMTADMTCTATFNKDVKSLAVTKKGTGTGTVTSSPAGINCGPDCKEKYNYGTVVTLTATPTSPGSVFAGWSGTSADCNDGKVTMTADMTCTAEFNADFVKPVADVKANGSDEPITISTTTPLSLEIKLTANSLNGSNADWWVLADTPFGWYYYNLSGWSSGMNVTYQGALFDLAPYEVMNMTLPAGSYTFYFGVDMVMDGLVTMSNIYYDIVKVVIE